MAPGSAPAVVVVAEVVEEEEVGAVAEAEEVVEAEAAVVVEAEVAAAVEALVAAAEREEAVAAASSRPRSECRSDREPPHRK